MKWSTLLRFGKFLPKLQRFTGQKNVLSPFFQNSGSATRFTPKPPPPPIWNPTDRIKTPQIYFQYIFFIILHFPFKCSLRLENLSRQTFNLCIISLNLRRGTLHYKTKGFLLLFSLEHVKKFCECASVFCELNCKKLCLVYWVAFLFSSRKSSSYTFNNSFCPNYLIECGMNAGRVSLAVEYHPHPPCASMKVQLIKY